MLKSDEDDDEMQKLPIAPVALPSTREELGGRVSATKQQRLQLCPMCQAPLQEGESLETHLESCI